MANIEIMETDHEQPRKLKTAQNPQAPQDENPISHPEKVKKDVANDKKKKAQEKSNGKFKST